MKVQLLKILYKIKDLAGLNETEVIKDLGQLTNNMAIAMSSVFSYSNYQNLTDLEKNTIQNTIAQHLFNISKNGSVEHSEFRKFIGTYSVSSTGLQYNVEGNQHEGMGKIISVSFPWFFYNSGEDILLDGAIKTALISLPDGLLNKIEFIQHKSESFNNLYSL